jgi:hypothetical protein
LVVSNWLVSGKGMWAIYLYSEEDDFQLNGIGFIWRAYNINVYGLIFVAAADMASSDFHCLIAASIMLVRV